jgi:dimethylsulfoniopropionate demethylase
MIKFFRFEELPFHGRLLRVARTGWSKQGGFEIYLDDSSLGERLWDALWQAGRDLDVGAGCPNIIERIEGGLLSYGADMTRANNPYESRFDSFVQLDRPIEVLSRPALERLATTGPSRRVMGVRLDSDTLPLCARPWPVIADGRRVGQVTSAAMSPQRGTGVAIGMIDRTHWDEDTAVIVETPEGIRTASICTLPFN